MHFWGLKMPFLVKVCNINVISMTKMYSETTPQNSNFEEKNPMTCPTKEASRLRESNTAPQNQLK